MRLYHPDLDRWHDFGSERSARIARRSGWCDAEPAVITCDECGFEARSQSGLAVHRRTHEPETSED